MILDKLENYEKYISLHPRFQKAFEFLLNNDLQKLDKDRYEIDGKKIFADIQKKQGKGFSKLETHNKYIDIQIALNIEDNIGWKYKSDCKNSENGYDSTKDRELFLDKPDFFFKLRKNHFAIFFQDDAHAPLSTKKYLHKIVIKVLIE